MAKNDVQVAAVIDAGKNPQHCGQVKIDEHIRQLVTMINEVNKQVAEWRSTIVNSQYDTNADPGDDVLYERLNTTLRAIDRDTGMALDALRRIRKGFGQYGRYCGDLEKYLADREAKAKGKSDAS